MERNWKGEFTYVGVRKSTVIDYVMVNIDIRKKIYKFKVGEKVDSDHLSLEFTGEEKKERDPEKEQKKKGKKEIETILWDNKAKEMYAKRTEKLCNIKELEEKNKHIKEKIGKEKKIVHRAIIRKKREKKENS